MFGLTWEKMFVSLILSALGLLELGTGFSLSWISEAWLLSLLFVLQPILVWLVPNAP